MTHRDGATFAGADKYYFGVANDSSLNHTYGDNHGVPFPADPNIGGNVGNIEAFNSFS
jgi:hypothetical protein